MERNHQEAPDYSDTKYSMRLFEIENNWKQSLSIEDTVVTSKGLKLTLRLRQKYYPDDDTVSGKVTAFINDHEVGYLPFGPGMDNRIQIGDLKIHSDHRRKGIASAMFDFVRKQGIPLQHYSDERDMSAAGKAFARSNPV